MKNKFLDELKTEGILADGAIGTEIYTRGIFINRCFDALNLSNPEIVRDIHKSYLEAGSRMIETNTFTANRLALAAHGLESQVADINRAGAKLARAVVGNNAYIAGSIGPVSWVKKDEVFDVAELKDVFREQMKALVDGGVDVLLLETFTNLEEIKHALDVARDVTDKPVITSVSLKYMGEGEFAGLQPEDVALQLDGWGADVIGVNCCDGPQGVFEAVRRMVNATEKPLSAMPNAGLPKMVHGRLLYLASPEYFAEYARRYAQLGVQLIGGCCGTTPAHIAEMKKYLKTARLGKRVEQDISIIRDVDEKPKPLQKLPPPIPPAQKSPFGAVLGTKFAISVEVDPPLGIDPAKAIEGARVLKEMGVDAVNIADGPRAMARMSPMALATLIKDQVGIETIVHYCCRDRNLLGMQMDLIGAEALGLHNMLIITGDPPKMGHYPDATAVFDIDSVGLIHFVTNLNNGLDFADRPMKQRTKLLIGCGFNPGAIDLDLEVERYKMKVDAGTEFAFSQPIYEPKLLETFLDRVRNVKPIPIFVGILPLASLRNAEFLHNEVPGMQVPASIMEMLEKASGREAQREIGMSVAKETLVIAKGFDAIQGAYIFPPFGNYKAVEKLLEVIR